MHTTSKGCLYLLIKLFRVTPIIGFINNNHDSIKISIAKITCATPTTIKPNLENTNVVKIVIADTIQVHLNDKSVLPKETKREHAGDVKA